MKLLPPVIRSDSQYSDLLSSTIDNNRNLILDDTESLVYLFIQQLNDAYLVVDSNIEEHPSASLSGWRTVYEIVILFRAWAQVVTKEDDIDLFYEIAQRFIDYQYILDGGYRLPADVIYRINSHPEHLKIEYTYDWLNPIFPQRELENMYNRNHPSFKDIVYRTRYTNSVLKSLYSRYQEASSVIHFSMRSLEIVEGLDLDKLMNECHTLIYEFFLDFLTIIEKYHEKEQIKLYAQKSKKVIMHSSLFSHSMHS